jgi:hypothetical protein
MGVPMLAAYLCKQCQTTGSAPNQREKTRARGLSDAPPVHDDAAGPDPPLELEKGTLLHPVVVRHFERRLDLVPVQTEVLRLEEAMGDADERAEGRVRTVPLALEET